MQTVDAVVRLQTLDGVWETCGTDRRRGVVPEGIQLRSNEWGPDTASFTLKRDSRAPWPDLTAFTPVEIEVGGIVVWEGYIAQTPTTDADGGSIGVECKGWQYHLDDDAFEFLWIHSKLGDWKDTRSVGTADLNRFTSQATVTSGDGSITLGWPKGTVLVNGMSAGITLDLGPDVSAYGISITTKTPSGSKVEMNSYMTLNARSSATAQIGSGTGLNIAASKLAVGTSSTFTGTFSTPNRYVHIFFNSSTTTPYPTAAADNMLQILAISIYGVNNVTGGKLGQVLGNQIIDDCLTHAPLLSSSSASISSDGDTFSIPHVDSIGGGKTPREYMTAVNAYYDNILKVGPAKSLIFKPRPTSPLFMVGSWGGSEFADASANSADEIYNKVVVEGEGPDGSQIRVPVISAQLASANATQVAISSGVTNGNFASGTTGWTGSGLTLTNPSSNSYGLLSAITGTGKLNGSFGTGFTAGVTYTLSFQLTPTQPWSYSQGGVILLPEIWFGATSQVGRNSGDIAYQTSDAAYYFPANAITAASAVGTTYTYTTSETPGFATGDLITITGITPAAYSSTETNGTLSTFTVASVDPVNNQFTVTGGTSNPGTATIGNAVAATPPPIYNIALSWTPEATVTAANTSLLIDFSSLTLQSSIDKYKVDNFTLTYGAGLTSLPDRRGFTRTKRLQSNSPITTTTGTLIGKAFLANHNTTPLKGSVKIQPGGVRAYNSGASVHPSQLLLKTGELMHLSQRIDPNSGAQGRDGQIASVSYDHSSQSADIAIDNQRNRFETLLERLSVVTGNRLGR